MKFLTCMYFRKIPPEAILRDNFYLQPLPKVDDCSQFWFSSTPVGRNSLAKIINAGVPEKVYSSEENWPPLFDWHEPV